MMKVWVFHLFPLLIGCICAGTGSILKVIQYLNWDVIYMWSRCQGYTKTNKLINGECTEWDRASKAEVTLSKWMWRDLEEAEMTCLISDHRNAFINFWRWCSTQKFASPTSPSSSIIYTNKDVCVWGPALFIRPVEMSWLWCRTPGRYGAGLSKGSIMFQSVTYVKNVWG